MRPEFDHHEEYLIAYYRQYGKQAAAHSAARDVTTVVIGAVFFGLGYCKDDVTWSVIGFVLVSYLVLRSLISGSRYNRTFASLIRKYEDAMQVAAWTSDGQNIVKDSHQTSQPPSVD